MEINQKCSDIKLTDEMKNEMSKFNSDEEFLRKGGFSIEALDRAAFGFSSEDIKTLRPNQLNIKWKDDYENVIYEQNKSGLSKIDWANKINLNEPIDVIFEKNKFFIDDGHHRFYAAKILNKPLNVNLTIKQNPIIYLNKDLSYDDFHRCAFSIFKKQTQFEGMEVSKKDLEEGNFMFEVTKGELEEEKKKKADRCLRIARKKIPKSSAYRSGNIVRCRQGDIWTDLKEDDSLNEKTDFSKEKEQGLHGWFARQGGKGKSKGWVDCNTCRDGKCKSCGRKEGESRAKYPSCRPTPSACKTKGKGKTWGKKS